MTNGLFIIGFQKCGTTYLHNLLAQQDYFTSAHVKETYYFNLDTDIVRKYFSDYLNLFEKDKILLDSSVSYVHDLDALKNITSMLPASKFILITRDAGERTISAIKHTRHVDSLVDYRIVRRIIPGKYLNSVELLKYEETLVHKAIELGEVTSRKFSVLSRLNINCDANSSYSNDWQFNYFANSNSNFWIDQVKNVISEDKILTINFSDLKLHSKRTVEQVCEFMQINDLSISFKTDTGKHTTLSYSWIWRYMFEISSRTGVVKFVSRNLKQKIKKFISQEIVSKADEELIKSYYEKY
jgi:hypothetical protein